MAALRRVGASARHYPLPCLALVGLAAGLLAQYLFTAPDVGRWILVATLLAGGAPVVVGTVRGVLRGTFAADIVAALAIVGAALTAEYLAGCVIVLMQTGGEALEDLARRRASASLQALLARAPHNAHRRVGDRIDDVPVDAVAVGDLLVVRPGELIPVDATITRGTAAVDESALTGEPLAEMRGPGAEVMSGSVCLDGALEVRALRPSGESQYEQIVRLVQVAQADKAPLGRLADRYAIVFTPVTLAMCALAYLLTRQPQAVVAVLVVATPCPLILATPVAIISGINRAARGGIIVKGGAAIERMGQATAVVFDTTGTLTAGSPVVERVVALNAHGEDDILRLAAGLEQLSGHQMARALVVAGQQRVGSLPVPVAVTEAAGLGVSGQVDGHTVDVGSLAFARQQHLAHVEAVERRQSEAGTNGSTTAVVGIDGQAAGLVI